MEGSKWNAPHSMCHVACGARVSAQGTTQFAICAPDCQREFLQLHMDGSAALVKMLAGEKAIRCEKQPDVPDHDGSKPLMFSIDGKDLQATNRKGVDWNPILSGQKKTLLVISRNNSQFSGIG